MAVDGGNRVPDQNAVGAAIGNQETLAIGDDRTRKLKRLVALPRIHGGVVLIGVDARGRADFGVADVGPGGGKAIAAHVVLAENDVSGLFRLGRNRVPDQHAVVAEVGDEEPLAVARHGNGVLQTIRSGEHRRLIDELFRRGVEVLLAEDEVCRGVVLGGDCVPNHHPVVARVGNVQPAVLNPDALGTEQRLIIERIEADGSEVSSAQHDIGGGIVLARGRDFEPDQHTVVLGIGHG